MKTIISALVIYLIFKVLVAPKCEHCGKRHVFHPVWHFTAYGENDWYFICKCGCGVHLFPWQWF